MTEVEPREVAPVTSRRICCWVTRIPVRQVIEMGLTDKANVIVAQGPNRIRNH